jgi:hypothetical protein
MASTTSPNDLVEVIHMESAALIATPVISDVSAQSGRPLQCGRFSTGMERFPEAPDKERVGRFCDGIAHLPETPETRRVGRFSTGMEQLPDAPRTMRVGSFADGYEQVGRR